MKGGQRKSYSLRLDAFIGVGAKLEGHQYTNNKLISLLMGKGVAWDFRSSKVVVSRNYHLLTGGWTSVLSNLLHRMTPHHDNKTTDHQRDTGAEVFVVGETKSGRS